MLTVGTRKPFLAVSPILLHPVRPARPDAGDDCPEAPAERLRQEGVQDGVDARVAVGEDVRSDLDGDRHRRDGVQVEGLEHKCHVDG